MYDTIRKRLKISSILILLATAIMLFLGITRTYNNTLNQEKTHLIQRVDAAYNILIYFNSQVNSGKMTKEKAQETAKDIIRGIIYSGGGYFFIIDYNKCIQLVQPVNIEYEGKYRCDRTDPKGNEYVKEFVEQAKNKEHDGFVSYYGPRNIGPSGFDAKSLVEKISYIKGFEPWGWLISSGIYVDNDVYDYVQKTAIHFGVIVFAYIFFVIGLVTINVIPVLNAAFPIRDYIKNLSEKKYDFKIEPRKTKINEVNDVLENIVKLQEHLEKSENEDEHKFGVDANFFKDI